MKIALLVIDMQNDYLWEKRKKQFSYNTPQLVSSVNISIWEALKPYLALSTAK